MTEEVKHASFNPEDAVEGGGGLAIDGATVKWQNCKFEVFDYQGKAASQTCFGVDFIDQESGEEYQRQYYSAASPELWLPDENDDDLTLIPVGGVEQLLNKTNFMLLMASLINAGFNLKDNRADIFEGLVTKMIVQTRKEEGLAQRTSKTGKKYNPSVVLVAEIIEEPGEGKKGGGAKQSGGGKKAAAPSEDVKDAATEYLIDALGEAGDAGIPKKKLPSEVLKALAKHPLRNDVVKIIATDDFLNDDDALWTVDKGNVVMK